MELMEVDPDRLRHRNAFNISAIQLTPAGLADAIRAHVPDFTIEYRVDPVRQRIAESWPRRIEDAAAREEWGWAPRFDTPAMVEAMLARLAERLGVASPEGG
jgi:nucleoside-diphosphate-sugar epimerase